MDDSRYYRRQSSHGFYIEVGNSSRDIFNSKGGQYFKLIYVRTVSITMKSHYDKNSKNLKQQKCCTKLIIPILLHRWRDKLNQWYLSNLRWHCRRIWPMAAKAEDILNLYQCSFNHNKTFSAWKFKTMGNSNSSLQWQDCNDNENSSSSSNNNILEYSNILVLMVVLLVQVVIVIFAKSESRKLSINIIILTCSHSYLL